MRQTVRGRKACNALGAVLLAMCAAVGGAATGASTGASTGKPAAGEAGRNAPQGSGASAAGAAAAAHIEEFLPQGRVSGVEAVQLRFSRPVAAFGQPGAQVPVDLACEGPVPSGSGRWLDDRRWTYTFERALPAGVRCVARPNPAFRTLDGQPLPGGARHAFDTGAPAVTDARPYPGQEIDEEQVFILRFDAPVDPQEVARHSHCVVEGLGERIPVKAVSDEHRESLMEASYMSGSGDPAAVALLQCARVLPPDGKVRLEAGPGIRAVGQPSGLRGSERARVLEYEVRPPFMARLSCTRERAGRPCLPIAPISVNFSAPVPRDALAGMSLRAGDTVFEPERNDDELEVVSWLNYPGPFPAGQTLVLTLPEGLRDDAGRLLDNADRYPLKVPVADYPPLAKFASGTFGVIERFAQASPQQAASAGQAAVPVTLRHIEADPALRGAGWSAGQVANLRTVDDAEVLRWYARLQRLDGGQWSEGQLKDIAAGRAPRDDYGGKVARIDARSVSLLKPLASARRLSLPGAQSGGSRPFEVVGIPLQEPGFHVLEIESPVLGASLLENGKPMYVRTGVLLTNLSLHVKQGRDDLLVWVTTLSGAEPVANAEINVLDCDGRALARGRTDGGGLWHRLEPVDAPDYCRDTGLNGLFVSARIPADHPLAHGAADYAFVLSGWDRGIESWRFNVPTASGTEPELLAHTVFDRSLFRAGEKVSMKHYLREETRDGLDVPAAARPDRLVIEHEGSSQSQELPVDWLETPSGGLAAVNEFDIPESAQLGAYTVRLTDEDQKWYGSSRFRVEEFRLPILAGRLDVRGGERPGVLVDPARLDVDMQLAWLAGGAASGQKVTLSAVSEDRAPRFDDYDDYRFAPPPRVADADSGEVSADEPDGDDRPRRRLFLDGHAFTLDADGTASLQVDAVPRADRPQRIQLEASFADPNGEVQTLSRSVDVWPSAVQAGLKAEGWDHAGRDIPVTLIALGLDAQPREGVAMRLLAVERKMYTVRKRMVGGFYRYDSRTERREIGTVCEGETGPAGTLACAARFDEAGSYELIAVAEDGQGRVSSAYTTLWVSGAGELWFGGQDDDRIDLIPAKREWAAGEEAEFQVRMPFREAVALVSVEREGVLWTKQVKLEGSDPVIRIPVSASWGPNAYVSVLVLRGRLYELPWQSFFEWGWRRPAAWLEAYGDNPDDTLVTSRIDLAKPAFRLGLAEIRIGSEADRLQVTVTPDRDVLRVREEATARLRVRLPDGSPAAHGSVAFAAVDEALLELAPNDSWAIHEAMHPRRSLGVRTATTQMEVVGRRHYGRKAVEAGGGGGTLPTRQLFDTLLSWQPMLQLDANGEAEVRFRVNDALTRFRLVAVADHGGGHFGTGGATIATRQDLQAVPGLPPVVREGDDYLAPVTVRNGTEEEREIEVRAFHDGGGQEVSLPPRSLRLGPGQSGTVSWRVSVPELAWPGENGQVRWRVEAGDGRARDSVAMTQRIEPRLPTTTVQAALRGLEAGQAAGLPVAAPAGALRGATGRVFGGIALDASASLVGGLQGVREWWQAYPHACLEQSASQAIALDDGERWRRLVDRLPSHMDDDGLLRYFPGTGPGSEVLTAYLVSASDEARRAGLAFELPEEALQRMLDGLQAFAEGRLKRDMPLSDTRMDSRRIMAMEALVRHGRASASMLTSFADTPDKWPTPTVVDWLSVLTHMPAQPRAQRGAAEARSLLAARMSVSGTAMAFSDTPLNAAPGLMATRVTSLSRLMLAVMDRPEWRDDLPRMAQGLLDARSGGAWDTTTDNLLAVLALARFSQRFEAVPATGAVRASLPEGVVAELPLPGKGEVATARLPWPDAGGTLQLRHEGQGRAWVELRAQARVPLAGPTEAGYRIVRRVVPVQRATQDAWSRGDVYRVELEIHARDAATWVAVSDPVPAGATILGSGLGRDAPAHLAAQGVEYYPPAFVERGASAYRAYFDYLPAGRVRLAYTVRLNAVGRFALPPTRIEALYRPDLYGAFPNEGMDVGAGPYDAVVQEAAKRNEAVGKSGDARAE